MRLRPLLRSDGPEWRRQRIEDEPFLRPVEPTQATTWAEAHSSQAWWNYLIFLRNSARDAQVIPLAIELEGKFAGQVTLGNIQHGSIRDCWIGYWVYSAVQGAGEWMIWTDGACKGNPGPGGWAEGEGIAAFWTGPATSEVLRAAAEAGLARYKQPREFIHVEALPRTPTGKINRRALREAHRKDRP